MNKCNVIGLIMNIGTDGKNKYYTIDLYCNSSNMHAHTNII